MLPTECPVGDERGPLSLRSLDGPDSVGVVFSCVGYVWEVISSQVPANTAGRTCGERPHQRNTRARLLVAILSDRSLYFLWAADRRAGPPPREIV